MEMNSKPSSPDDHKYENYCVEEALRTLKKAEEIKADERMMKLVQELAKKEKRAISSIAQLKSLSKKATAPKDNDQDEESEEY